MRLQAFTYRIYPTAAQQTAIAQQFGCCRFVYNNGLELKVKTYEQTGETLSCFDLIKRLPSLKQDHPWLRDADSQALQMALRNLDNAFLRFFQKQGGFPKFKSRKHSPQSCQFPQRVKVDFAAKMITFPKIGHVRLKLRKLTHRFDGKIKTVTLRQTPSGKYFVSVLVERPLDNPPLPPVTRDATLGIDVGIKDFAILSTGEKIAHPKTLKRSLRALKRLQRAVSRKVKGSQNRNKARRQLAKRHEHVANQRKNFLHQLSHRLTNENQVTSIATEDLHIRGMIKNHRLAQAIADSAWGMFDAFLTYKCVWRGKHHLHIGRFEPSSKTCSCCGAIYTGLTLKVRQWTCAACGVTHDRDVNAARNIRNFAVHPQNVIHQ